MSDQKHCPALPLPRGIPGVSPTHQECYTDPRSWDALTPADDPVHRPQASAPAEEKVNVLQVKAADQFQVARFPRCAHGASARWKPTSKPPASRTSAAVKLKVHESVFVRSRSGR